VKLLLAGALRRAPIFRRMPDTLLADVGDRGADQRELYPSHRRF
jgi:hypothetical protein